MAASDDLSPFLAQFRERYFRDRDNTRVMWQRIVAAGHVSQPEPAYAASPTYSFVATSSRTVKPFKRDRVRYLFCNDNLSWKSPVRAKRWCAASSTAVDRLRANINILRDLIYVTTVDGAYTLYLYRVAGEDGTPGPINDLSSFALVPLRDLQLCMRFWKFSHDEEGRPSPQNTATYLASYGRTEHQHRFALDDMAGTKISICVDIRAVLNLYTAARNAPSSAAAAATAVATAPSLASAARRPAPVGDDGGAPQTLIFRVLARTETRVTLHTAPPAFASLYGQAQPFRALDEHAPTLAAQAWYADDGATQPLLVPHAVRDAVLALNTYDGSVQTALSAANGGKGVSRTAANAVQAALALSQRPSLVLEAVMAAEMRDEHLVEMAGRPGELYAYVAQFQCQSTHLINAMRATLAALRIMTHVTRRDEPVVARRLALYASAVRWAPPQPDGAMPLVVAEPDGNTLCWGHVDALHAADTLHPPPPPPLSVPPSMKRPREHGTGDDVDDRHLDIGIPRSSVSDDHPPPAPVSARKRMRRGISTARCEPPDAVLRYWPLPIQIDQRVRHGKDISVMLVQTHCLSIAVGIGFEFFRSDALLLRTRGMQLNLPAVLTDGSLCHRLHSVTGASLKNEIMRVCDGNTQVTAAVLIALQFFALFILPIEPGTPRKALPPEYREAIWGLDNEAATLAYTKYRASLATASAADRERAAKSAAAAVAADRAEHAPLESLYAILAAPDDAGEDDRQVAQRRPGNDDADGVTLPNANAVATHYASVDMIRRLIVAGSPKVRPEWYQKFHSDNAYLLYNNGARPPVRAVIRLIESYMHNCRMHAESQPGKLAAVVSDLEGVVMWLAFQHVVAACFLIPGHPIPRGPFSLLDFELL